MCLNVFACFRCWPTEMPARCRIVRSNPQLELRPALRTIAVPQMPFSLKNACAGGAKRENPYSDSGAPTAKKPATTKAPAASSLVMMESAPKNQRAQRLPASAPLEAALSNYSCFVRVRCHLCCPQVAIYKITNKASDLWEQFADTEACIWQVQMDTP